MLLFFKLWSMSKIFLQKDNITILGDIYDYPIYKYDKKEILIETITQKAVILQIVLTINWKQKLYRKNYDLKAYSRITTDWSEWECSTNLELKDNSWYDLEEFLIEMWYPLQDFDISEEIEKVKSED